MHSKIVSRRTAVSDAVAEAGVSRIVRCLAALLQTRRERARPIATRRRLVSTLFGRASNVFMVAIAAAVCGAAAYVRDGSFRSVPVAAFEVVILLVRCGVILSFQKRWRVGAILDPDAWLVGFGVLAIGSSVCWGTLSFLGLAFSHDPVLYVIPTLSAVGTAGAVAARNSGVPRLAKLQLAVSLTPICAGCLFADDQGFRLLLLLVPAMAAGLVILIAERNEQLVELIETQAELARLSQTDALTHLANRRFLDSRLREAATAGCGFSLLMIDVDNFKAFNDRYGHLAGDAVLCRIAAVLRQAPLGERDVVARYGGEEFAILLEDTGATEAAMIAERLRLAVQTGCRDPLDGSVTTISVGHASTRPGDDPSAAMREADAALYRAKRGGRNRVAGSGYVACDDRQVA